MGNAFAIVCLLGELALSVALMGAVVVTLGFSSEAHRNGATWILQAFNLLGFVLTLVPLGLTCWVGFRRFASDRPFEDVPLGLGLPLLVGILCAGGSFLSMVGGEWLSHRVTLMMNHRARAALRAAVEGGAQDKSCDLVAGNPNATAEDMHRCRAYIESLPDARARWAEFQKFVTPSRGFKLWHPLEFDDPQRWYPMVVQYDQEWFLRTFYETWMAQPGAFQSEEELYNLTECLGTSGSSDGWVPKDVGTVYTQVLPRLAERLGSGATPQARLMAGMVREKIEELRKGP